jgi:hypoxanthine phosphoribosyltransferase
MDKNYITWQQLDEIIDNLANIIVKAQFAYKIKYEGILGLPRGGLIPAVMLSHKLNIPLITKISKEKTPYLLVDDINDTGTTLKNFLGNAPGKGEFIDAVVICNKRTSSFKDVPFSGMHINDVWQVFPWETEDSSKADYLN